jgi:hypothetical protein
MQKTALLARNHLNGRRLGPNLELILNLANACHLGCLVRDRVPLLLADDGTAQRHNSIDGYSSHVVSGREGFVVNEHATDTLGDLEIAFVIRLLNGCLGVFVALPYLSSTVRRDMLRRRVCEGLSPGDPERRAR